MTKYYLIAICLILGGCDIYNNYRSQFILSKGWVGPTDDDKPKPLYCYRTIGQVECYNEPIPGQEGRLVSAYEGGPSKCQENQEKFSSSLYEEPTYGVEYTAPMSITRY